MILSHRHVLYQDYSRKANTVRPSQKRTFTLVNAEDLTRRLTNRFQAHQSRFPQKGCETVHELDPVNQLSPCKKIQCDSWEISIYCRYKCSFVYSPWSVQIFVHQQYQLLQYTSISFSQAFVFTMSRPIWPKVSKTLWTHGVLCACSIQPFSNYIYV